MGSERKWGRVSGVATWQVLNGVELQLQEQQQHQPKQEQEHHFLSPLPLSPAMSECNPVPMTPANPYLYASLSKSLTLSLSKKN